MPPWTAWRVLLLSISFWLVNPCARSGLLFVHTLFQTDKKAKEKQCILWFLSPTDGKWILSVFSEVPCFLLDFIFVRLRKQLNKEWGLQGLQIRLRIRLCWWHASNRISFFYVLLFFTFRSEIMQGAYVSIFLLTCVDLFTSTLV